jgi:hypothetical protein
MDSPIEARCLVRPSSPVDGGAKLIESHAMEIDPALLALRAGWAGFLGGVISGAVIGLKFHRENWLGGYASRERRMVRLGHISFFGIGMICLFYGLTLKAIPHEAGLAETGALALAVALVTMPATCFLTAWKPYCRHGFFVPVLSAATGIVVQLLLLR